MPRVGPGGRRWLQGRLAASRIVRRRCKVDPRRQRRWCFLHLQMVRSGCVSGRSAGKNYLPCERMRLARRVTELMWLVERAGRLPTKNLEKLRA